MAETQLSDNLIEFAEQVEGDQIGTKNYRFSRIGNPVPIESDAESEFDPQSPPSHPLALSERHGLIFVAHSTGFCVAKTKDVMEVAKKEESVSSIQELSVVDISIGKVSILALSANSSILAATVGGDIHFFSVTALLNKESKPYFSNSPSNSICIKDMRWTTKSENNYLLLSSEGKLYYGVNEDPLKEIMDNVDAVEWSVKGNHVAVAKKTVLSILSSKFREKLRISLLLKSLIGDSEANPTIKVDSIRWVRRDCIIIGCFEVTADGKEENYLVQVITNKKGNITKASNPVVQVFSDVFLALSEDAVPFASGPHMFLNYLDSCKLAFIANRKNVDQHIVLFGWALNDDNSEAVMIDILNDAWFPTIDTQGNGDENLILGLYVDKISQDDNIKLILGDEEKETSPCCVLLCVTVDSKITMFHFFSAACPMDTASFISDGEEEENFTPAIPSESGLTKITSISEKKVDEIHMKKHQQPPADDQLSLVSPSTSIRTASDSSSGNKVISPLVNLETLKGDNNQQKGGGEKVNVQPTLLVKPYHKDGPGAALGNFSSQKLGDTWSGGKSFSGNLLKDMSNQSISQMDLQKSFKGSTEIPGRTGSSNSQSMMSSESFTTGKFISSERNDDGRSLTRHTPGSLYQNPLRLKEFSGPSNTAAMGIGKIESFPPVVVHNSQSSSLQENLTVGKSSTYNPNLNKESFRNPSPTVPFSSEPNLSKQSLNVEEMAKDLDRLMECIEGEGGFKDISIALLKNSVLALEEGIWDLSERCRTWKATMDERLGKIQHLLDKTVQVLARKIYMEGIVKQASDSRYWDRWNLQKLNSELELKQRHIAEVNQDLTNQLIQLERHFNTLEYNKFGENAVQNSRRALPSKHVPSRGIQSLHSLRNTISAQLSAAEQLSECLSKQMTSLSIEPSLKKTENVRRELFETIGIPYDNNASFNSPGEKGKFGIINVSEENSLISTSAFSKEQSLKTYHSSAVKSSESEIVRRRRDSLDRNWASFEPPKTTVKRMLLQEDCQKASPNRSSFFMDNQQQHMTTTAHLQEGSPVTRANNSNTTILSYPSKIKGIQDTQPLQWGDKPRKQSSENNNNPSTPTFQWGNKLSPLRNSSAISISKESGGLFSKSFTTDGDMKKDKQQSIFTGSFSVESGKSLSFPISSSPLVLVSSIEAAAVGTASPTKVQLDSEIKSYVTTSVSTSLPHVVLPSSSTPSQPKPTTTTITFTAPHPLTTLNANSVQLPVSSPASSFPTFPSITPPTNLTTKPPSLNTQVPKFNLRTTEGNNTTTELQTSALAMPSVVTSSSPAVKIEPVVPPKPATRPLFTDLGISATTTPKATTTTTASTTTTTASDLALKPIQEQPSTSSTETTLLPSSDVPFTPEVEEDEMEEEAPEMMNQSSIQQFTSGNNLGSLGLGSTAPLSAAPKSNPFGVSFSNNAQPISQFTSTPPVSGGELFRPASFSFPSPQPPSQPASNPFAAFSGGFGSQQQSASSGSGQQALGSVLGSFGQSRQFGTGLPGSGGFNSAAGGFGGGAGFGNSQVAAGGFSNAAGAGGGFASLASAPVGGGFAAAATVGGGFAAAAATGGGGGFASLASAPVGGGFAAAATVGGGFAAAAATGGGGGFAAAATAGSGFAGAASAGGFAGTGGGGGFGGFGNQQGSGGFSGFGNSGGGAGRPPSELFTQIRK